MPTFMKLFTWKHRALVLGTTLLVVGVFGALGWWIGSHAGSSKAGVIVAVLLSYPVSLWLVATRVRATALSDNTKNNV